MRDEIRNTKLEINMRTSTTSKLRMAIHAGTLLAVGVLAQNALGQGAVAYRGVTIETAGKDGRLENATLVIRDGKIEAVGVSVKPPDDARIIEGRGKTIMPGIIDPLKEIAIAGSGPVDVPALPTRGGGRRGGGPPIRGGTGGGGFTRVVDNLYPYDPIYRVMLRSGLTGLNLVTSSYGQAAVVRLAPTDPDNMLVNGEGVLFTTVTNDSASLDVVKSQPASRRPSPKKGETISRHGSPNPADAGWASSGRPEPAWRWWRTPGCGRRSRTQWGRRRVQHRELEGLAGGL